MAGRIAGITIEIGGDTTKLQSALKGVDSTLRQTQNNLRDINKLLKLDPKNTELLTQKQKNLQQAIKSTKDRLTELKNAQSQVKQGTQEWDALQREIIDTEQKIKSLEKEYKQFGSVAAQQIKAAGEDIKQFGQKIADVGDKMTMRITLPLVAAGTAAAKVASDYEENLNKIDVAFGDSADKVRQFTDNAMDAYGLSKVAASGSASAFGALAKGVGLTEDAAANVSIKLTGLTSDLASYFNTSNDVSAKALESIFTGESEALKKFGVVMTDTNLKQFAKDHGQVYEKLTQEEKVMLRYNFVLEKTKDAQGDYSRTSDGTANSIKTFQAAVQDLATTFGSELLPIITPMIQGLTRIINQISALPAPVKKALVVGAMVLAVIGPLLSIGGRLIMGIGMLMTFAPALAGAFLPFIGIAAAIAAAIVGVVLAVKNWDKIVDYVKDLWNRIKTEWHNGIEATKRDVDNFTQRTKQKFTELKTAASAKMSEIKTSISSAWSGIVSATSNAMGNLQNAVRAGFEAAKYIVSASVQNLKSLMNFSWSLPHLKVPHISISGSFSLKPPRAPHFSVSWYKKAYDNAVMFTSPTVLGTASGMKGFGDGNGAEVVLGMNKLRELVGMGQGDVVINVYATPDMNINQLADKIQDRFVQLQKQRSAAYA